MTDSHPPLAVPERVVNLDTARRRHGAKVDRMVTMITVGDPLADAVIVELDRLGKPGRQILNAGLSDGLASLGERPPAAIAALLEQLETVPSWVDPVMIDEGSVASLSIPRVWFELAAITSALVHTYASPAIARLLVQTGQLTTMAPRRLVETGMWAQQSTRPGGLRRGAPGYVATVQVRLLHARVRATALKHGWEADTWGVPISQVDVARTWLDFTLTPVQALATVGIDLSPDEEGCLYRYWHYIAYLLGLDESLYRDVVDRTSACSLQDLLDSTTAAPDENSRALTAAMVQGTAKVLAAAPNPVLPEDHLRDLINGLLRASFGDDKADHLGIPVAEATHLLPLIRLLNSQARYWQNFSPASAEAARAQALGGPTPVQMAAAVPGGTAYQQNIADDDSGAPAA